eukprot:7375-Heterococcus_DN1.PRE.2
MTELACWLHAESFVSFVTACCVLGTTLTENVITAYYVRATTCSCLSCIIESSPTRLPHDG